ncbi:ceramide synthase 4-like [Sarcophilus harrisii]|uniref:Ceramide synthase 4 n=1 Tax=Sarcophilus harrisii TaxID=9305 RepID=A0A7N4PQC4_SARHA|nr:ceramide synthase 4-like [Sarcophilus harrisii]XP_031804155.1 ceramide synthase 4-like [Sarcophilus harrisii]
MLTSLYDRFWKQEYWFPSQYSWADMEDSNGVIYTHPKDLLAAIPLVFIILIVRYSFERVVGLPLARLMGVHDARRIKAFHNPILESFFRSQSQNPKEAQLNDLANKCSLSLRQVQRWFRCRRNQEQPLLSKKFCEACWRFIVYSYFFFGGFLAIYNEPWLWKSKVCWEGFPKQPLKPAIYWWYLLEFGFYLSLITTLSFDVKRKDFREQIIHHFSAIILIYFSYCANYIRIGTLVMLLHDVSDVFLEAGKMFNYAQWKNSSEIVFIIFTVIFLFSRLILLPYRVLYTTIYDSMAAHKPFFGYYFSNALLFILQALNIFWSFLILQMFFKLIIIGKIQKDVRSDIEEEDEQSETEQQKNGSPAMSLVAFPNPKVPEGLAQTKRH